MCFTEYLGYTCGHASSSVKRLCPLTTQLYNNPCCAHNAVRPFLSPTFCPACARILHGRWVNILECEHRFMHERGACGCSAKFPHLQQPRVVSHYMDDTDSIGSDHHHHQHDHASEASTQIMAQQSDLSGSAMPFVPSHGHAYGGTQYAPWDQGSVSFDGDGSSFERPGSAKGKGKQRRDRKARQQEQERRGSTTTAHLAPLFEERKDTDTKKPVVAVRMMSLYGAEWLQDHAPLHVDGRCSCPVRFQTYESPLMPVADEAGPGADLSYSHINTLAEYDQQYLAHQAGGAAQGEHAEGGAGSSSQQQKQQQGQNPLASTVPHVTTTPGHPARWACSPEERNDDDGAGAATTSSTPFANHPVDMQTAWYDQSETPLAGLPIGAGPEGDSHMPPFEECQLSQHYPKRSQHRRSASH
ncbi:hypothetical protein F4818DRAFT_457820 [Hypoxylon cercidicola]|nr:hypothetical protein F4818DRAFT_457820 [Hypoxylon cercidicola]